MSALIPGFDYRLHKEVSLTRAGWREQIRLAVKDGGWRKAEAGETFAYGRQHGSPALLFEIYDIVQG